ncbi:MAG: hypothetical protein H6Q70_972 [Firmicutes bacterium]|nr:hypothetical protein [Bacillota bacterium]
MFTSMKNFKNEDIMNKKRVISVVNLLKSAGGSSVVF